jgi:peroxiredoxin
VSAGRIPTDSNLYTLPAGIPVPEDDGAAKHLVGARIPGIELRSTGGGSVNVGEVAKHLSVFFLYPATIAPPAVIPGEWSEVPGARGCTLQNIGFREAYADLSERGCAVFGVSGQGQIDPVAGLAEQIELKRRLGLPFDLLNDSRFELVRALQLPTFTALLKNPSVEFEGKLARFPLQGRELVKRLTFVADGGRIERVFYPVFPPHESARAVLEYLRERPASSSP